MAHIWPDHDVIARLPIDGCGHYALSRQLQAVHNPEYLQVPLSNLVVLKLLAVNAMYRARQIFEPCPTLNRPWIMTSVGT